MFEYKIVRERIVHSEVEKMEENGWTTRYILPRYLSVELDKSEYLLIFEKIVVPIDTDFEH